LVFFLGAGGPAELCKVVCVKKIKNKNKNKMFFGWLASWAQVAPWSSVRLPASSKRKKKKKEKRKTIILFYLYIYIYIFKFKFYLNLNFFPPWGLAPRTFGGLSHGSPPFDFEVAFCPPPNSYILPLLLYKIPHESYFSLFLCSHLW
jgi:hypothetical protein